MNVKKQIMIILCTYVSCVHALKNSWTIGPAWSKSETSYLASPRGNFLQQLNTETAWNMCPVIGWGADVELSEHVEGGLDIGAGFLRHGRAIIRSNIFFNDTREDLREGVSLSMTSGDVAAHISFVTEPFEHLVVKWLFGYAFAKEFETLTSLATVDGNEHLVITERMKNKGYFVGVHCAKPVSETTIVCASYAFSWRYMSTHSTESLDATTAALRVNLLNNSFSLGLTYNVCKDVELKCLLSYSKSRNDGRGETIGFDLQGNITSVLDNLVYLSSQVVILSGSISYLF